MTRTITHTIYLITSTASPFYLHRLPLRRSNVIRIPCFPACVSTTQRFPWPPRRPSCCTPSLAAALHTSVAQIRRSVAGEVEVESDEPANDDGHPGYLVDAFAQGTTRTQEPGQRLRCYTSHTLNESSVECTPRLPADLSCTLHLSEPRRLPAIASRSTTTPSTTA
jgi:hypothetical protein